MSGPVTNAEEVTSEALARMADGLDVLVRLHDREVDHALLQEMQTHRVAQGLGELVSSDAAHARVAEIVSVLQEIGVAPGEAVMDNLAAEFADLYLTHGYRVSPSGSVWLTEDKLERQLPMFDVRDWYDHYGISVPNWRVRADDHLVHELQFVAFLCRHGDGVAARDAGRFLDLHVLPWLPEFCRRGKERVGQPLYAALLGLTIAYLDDLRSLIEEITGEVRDVRKVATLDTARAPEPEAVAYAPGVAESW